MPEPGQVILYPNVLPALKAASYTVTAEQRFEGGEPAGRTQPIASVPRHFEVVSPRFSMSPAEVFSVYPPPNATGAFDTRLPQIVLKRRTLPWERAADRDHPDETTPWLALVVLGEGEANFRRNVRVAEALPAERFPGADLAAEGTCDVIEVPERVIEAAFPAREEVTLLCHSREVNALDTEYADEDGWVSVVISNRLPQQGQSYRAYLVSLEGALDLLPSSPPVDDERGAPLVFDVTVLAQLTHVLTRPDGEERRVEVAATSLETASVATRDIGTLEAIGGAQLSGFLVHGVDFASVSGAGMSTHAFPVLAFWNFTCEEGGDFQFLMENLDVAMIGSAPRDADAQEAAERLPVTDTGHSFIDHVSRRGISARAWYRGPLVPRVVSRRDPQPFHVADQARRVTEDGIEDLSEASAFEIGRLLAISDPLFLAELHRRRRAGIAAGSLEARLEELEQIRGLVDARLEVGRHLELALLASLAVKGDAALKTIGDPIGIASLLADDDDEVISKGLGVPVSTVRNALSRAITTTPLDEAPFQVEIATSFDEVTGRPESLASLSATLRGMRSSIAEKAGLKQDEEERPPPHLMLGIDAIRARGGLLGALFREPTDPSGGGPS